MGKSNIKTPILFRVGVAMLCAVLFSSYMMSGLYARYSSNVTGSATAQVAKFSYKIFANGSEHSIPANISDIIGNGGAVFAVEESFTIENDGEVSFEYDVNLSITDKQGDAVDGYTLGAISEEVYMLSSNSKVDLPNYVENRLYYKLEGDTEWRVVEGSSISDILKFGSSHTYTVLYFIDLTTSDSGLPSDTRLNESIDLKYDVTCTQVD
jgi:hypothetical protein